MATLAHSTNRRAFLRRAGAATAAMATVPSGAFAVCAVATSPLMEKIKAFDDLHRFGDAMPDETEADEEAYARHVESLTAAMYEVLNVTPATREDALAYMRFATRHEVFGACMIDCTDLSLMMSRLGDFLRLA